MYYVVLIIISCGVAFKGRQSRFWMPYYVFCASMLIFVAGARWETGTDWWPYLLDYREPGTRKDFESGYVLLTKLCFYITDNYTVFLFICAFISIGLIFVVCYKFVGLSFISIILYYSYYYLGSFLGAERRQFAIALCLLAIYWIAQRKPVMFLLTVCAAALFHVSSLIFLPAYWVYYAPKFSSSAVLNALSFKFTFWQMWKWLIVKFFILTFIVFLAVLLAINREFIEVKVIEYVINNASYDKIGPIGIVVGIVKRSFIVVVGYIGVRNSSDARLRGLFNLYLVSVLMYGTLSFISPMFSVMTIYYSIAEILLIPLSLSAIRMHSLPKKTVLIVWAALQTTSILWPYWNLYVPYYIFFSSQQRSTMMY